MKNRNDSGICPTSQEISAGLVYFGFQLCFQYPILQALNGLLGWVLDDAAMHFAYYLVNFLVIIFLLRRFLGRSAAQARKHPVSFLLAVILGLAAYYACFFALDFGISRLLPDYANRNDASIAAMLERRPLLMLLGTVILVPLFEECIFRGLIFRPLWDRSHTLAYLSSMVYFSLIHILGYWGEYSPLEFGIALVQYLPAGLCLAWCYTKAETIFAPIAVHAAVNYITIQSFR